MLTEEQINTKIQELTDSGRITQSILENSPNIIGGCILDGNTVCFKDGNDNIVMILPLEECEGFLNSLEVRDELA